MPTKRSARWKKSLATTSARRICAARWRRRCWPMRDGSMVPTRRSARSIASASRSPSRRASPTRRP
jgi:hypothetical protein